jgi:CheY-like chemotaxis protein
VRFSARPIWIHADATRIAQVIGNLLQNAVKFTPRGGSTSICAAALEGRAEVVVRDTGLGMEPERVEEMFEPFAQLRGGMARSLGGLGLGLALVKGLVELHGGRVTGRSEGVGRGSEFRVTLPLAAPPGATAQEAQASSGTGGALVLLVEDNVDAALTLADLLRMEGHRVEVSHDGRAGLALARELRPQVVLCDLGLPDLDGFELARALRAEPRTRSSLLVAVSGYAQPEDVQRALAAGFDAHLAKPPSLNLLRALLARAA